MQKLVGIDVKQVSVEKYNQSLAHIKSFLRFKHIKSDFLLKDLKLQFLHDLECYLKNTVYKTIQRLRRVVRVSVGAEYLVKALFVLHKANKPKVQVIYLSEPELISLENHQFSQEGLQQVRDMFVFCCYTGLAYQEMANLEENFIVKGFDNELRIEMNRQKTGKKIAIPLLPKANLILDK